MKIKIMKNVVVSFIIIIILTACNYTSPFHNYSSNTEDLQIMPRTSMASTESHTVIIGVDSTLWSMGNNEVGQLGCGTNLDRVFFNRVGIDYGWSIVDTGWRHTVAIKYDGTLWAWGDNATGQLGDGTRIRRYEPVKIGSDIDWVKIAASASRTFAIK